MSISLTRTAAVTFFLMLSIGSAFAQITGPTTVYVGTTNQYSFDDGAVEIGTFWTIVGGTEVSSWNVGTTYYATVNWTHTGSGSVKFSAFDGMLGFLPLTVSMCSISAPTPPATGTSRCGAGTFTLVATPGSGGTSIKWYTGSSGGSAVYTGTNFTTPTLSISTTYYITTFNTTTLCESSPRSAVSLVVNNVGSLAPAVTSALVSFSGLITLSGHTGSILRWEKNVNSGGWTTISNTTATYTYAVGPVSAVTSTYLRAVLNNGCGNPSYSAQANIATYPAPAILVNGATPSSSTVYHNYGYGVTLSIPTAGHYTSYQWTRDGVNILGATSNSHVPALGGLYRIRVTVAGGANATTVGVTVIQPNMQGDSVNIVSRTTFFKSGVTTATARFSMQPKELAQVFDYTDGTGRVVQKVAVGQSPSGGDVIIPSVYGKNGVVDSVFLPYATSSVKGRFRPNAIRGSTAVNSYSTGEQYSAYQNTPKVATDSKPYSVSVFRNTPESGVRRQAMSGSAWQLDTLRTVRSQRAFSKSTSNPVLRWKADATTTGYYPNNTVWMEMVTDENGNKTKVFTDKRGLTVLKKAQANAGATLWLQTYYVYDDYGQLVMEIPPKAMDLLGSGTTLDAKILTIAELVFKYTYDARGRLIQKKVPGSAAQNIVYDKLDRVVLAQDGNQKTLNIWMFIKYDYKNRPAYSGSMSSTSDRATLQSQFDALDYSTQPYFEKPAVSSTYLGYSNTVFPMTGLTHLQSFYYDDYDFDANASDDYGYDNAHIAGMPAAASTAVRGLLTGTKTRILGTPNYLVKCIFYDALDRPIQVRGNNHLNLTVQDKTSIYYVAGSLTDKIEQVRSTHVAPSGGVSTSTTISQRYTYDNSWRTTGIFHSINFATESQVAAYEYNALGQLVAKKLHNTGSAFLQTVDMRYNIRGWLTSINNARLMNDSGVTNNDTNDYFGMELLYTGSELGLGNSSRFDGSISAIKWKNAGSASGTAGQRSYKFGYDNSDRLLSATFQAYTGSAWTAEANTLNETMTYESNGNISTLVRNHNLRGLSGTTVTSTASAIDNLTYTYSTANQNRLLRVSDASGNTAGFADGVNTTSEYKYDTLGSMKIDRNKGISAVTYNELGKPQQMTLTNGQAITYTYDAAGTKLQTLTLVGVTPQTRTDYVAGFVYTNNSMSYFSSPEGRVVKNGVNFEYQYAIADHQGNTRVVFSSVTPSPTPALNTFDDGAFDQAAEFLNVNPSHRVPFTAANHTPGGSKVIRMNQTYSAGPAWNKKVYTGDKVDMEVYVYYEPTSGWSNSNQGVSAMITAIAGAFGGVSGGGGESGSIFAGVNSALSGFGLGPNQADNSPSAFLNYILFDKDYKVINMGWTAVPETANFSKQKISIPTVTVKEAGYIFVYLSYEGLSNTYVYFDDFKVTHTPTNIIQSNEYYPFGMQAASSWTRDNAVGNNYLSNGGTELNSTTGLYDLDFRNYDPVLGRLSQVDPLAAKYSSLTPYNFALNDPAYWNDPTGADVLWGLYTREEYNRATMQRDQAWVRGGSAGDLSPEAMAGEANAPRMGSWYVHTTMFVTVKSSPFSTSYEIDEIENHYTYEETQGSSSDHDLPWMNVAAANVSIWGGAFSIAQHGPRPVYQGPKSWAAEAKLAGKIANKLGALGLVVTGADMVTNGVNTSNTLDATFGAVSFAGLIGAAIGGTYFVANLITAGVTGQTLGQHVDNNFYILPGVIGGSPFLLIPKK
jgi:RHS repeat-associated protein